MEANSRLTQLIRYRAGSRHHPVAALFFGQEQGGVRCPKYLFPRLAVIWGGPPGPPFLLS